MEAVFLKILNMSISASWLVLAVAILRLLLKKAPRWISVALWAMVGVRLVCPISLESIFSLIPSAETVPPTIVYEQYPNIESGVPAVNSIVNPILSTVLEGNPATSINPIQIWLFFASVLWVSGMTALLLYAVISYLRIYIKVRESTPLRDNIMLCDRIPSPFILGIFRPQVYLPSDISPTDAELVIAHENAHLKRRDHWWKPLGFLLLTVYWFNPIMWVAYILLCRDIEFACDERVLKEKGYEIKKPYSDALINCSVSRKHIVGCPLAFGEVGVKNRIKSVLNYKKPALWIILVSLLVCIAVGLCFLTDPVNEDGINERLAAFLDVQIYDHFEGQKSFKYYRAMDYEVIGTEKKGKDTTVYMWVLYHEYSYGNNLDIKLESGSHILTAITARKTEDYYTLVEYWEPRDGAYYDDDIKERIPFYLWYKAFDSTRYVKKQIAKCDAMAKRYFEQKNNNSVYNDQALLLYGKLKESFPSYFQLDASKGLAIYVWQIAENSYSCEIFEDKSTVAGLNELMPGGAFTGRLPFSAVKALVCYYGLSREDIRLYPVQVPHSSFAYEITEEYRQTLVSKLFDNAKTTSAPDSYMDLIQCDPDCDGTTEQCYLANGNASGTTAFRLILTEDGHPQYCDHYGFFTLANGDAISLSLEKHNKGFRLKATYKETNSTSYFYPSFDEGVISLYADESNPAEEGEKIIISSHGLAMGIIADYFHIEPTVDTWGVEMQVDFSSKYEFTIHLSADKLMAETKGVLTTSPEYQLKVYHQGRKIPFETYMREALKQDYTAPQLAWDTVLYYVPDKDDQNHLRISGDLRVYGDFIPKGNYVLCKPVWLETADGERTERVYEYRFSIS